MNATHLDHDRIGGYQVLTRLSAGGMGEVFLARRTGVHRFEKWVAIKIIRASQESERELRTMFLDEARLMARLSHPAIAQVYDFGEEEQQLYLVMEYVTGISFHQLFLLRPPPRIAVLAMAEVCLGLHAAHSLADMGGRHLGVVHRDVSPDNLMLTFDGCVKILDFGIALMRDRETQATQCGQVKGKPAYMSPEQVTNRSIDHRTDIFSASIVLHELLSGTRLFVGQSIYSIARAIETMKIPPPSTVAHAQGGLYSISSKLDELVLRGLQRDPGRRFQTALEMAQALQVVAAADPGESLDQYAIRELINDRSTHARWLQELIQGSDSSPVIKGREKGVATAPVDLSASEPPTRVAPPDQLEKMLANTIQPARSLGKWILWASFFLLLAVGASYAFWLMSVETETQPQEPSLVTAEKPPQTLPIATTETPLQPQPQPQPTAVVASGEEPAATPKPPPAVNVQADKKKATIRPKPHKPIKAQVNTPIVPPEAGEKPNPRYGFLMVAADPYADVRIDGVHVGYTPLLRHRLTAGEHEVVLVSPDTGQVRLKQKVTITENTLEKLIVH